MIRRMSRLVIFAALMLGTILFAMWRGAAAERSTITVFATAWLLSLASVFPVRVTFLGIDWRLLLIDLLIFLALAMILVRYRQRSTAIIAGIQLVIVIFHLVKMIDPAADRLEYRIMNIFWAYIQLILLDLATAGRIWRLPDWLRFLRPSPVPVRATSRQT